MTRYRLTVRRLFILTAIYLALFAGGAGAAGLTPSSALRACTTTVKTVISTVTQTVVSTVTTTVTTPATTSTATTTTAPTPTTPSAAVYGPVAESCSGVNVTAADDLPSVVAGRANGTTFCLQPGTYTLSGPVNLQWGDSIIGQPGVILDGHGAVASCLVGHSGLQSWSTPYVTLKSLVVRNCTGIGIQTGDQNDVENVESYQNQVGVELNAGTTLRASSIHDNRQYGIDGGPGQGIVIDSNEVAGNNTGHFDPGNDAGGSKIVGSTAGASVTWANNYVHDNYGNGIWSDGNVTATYTGNVVTHNTGAGIDHEISWDATVTGNTITDNQTLEPTGESCWHGGQVDIVDSQNVTVAGNTITAANGTNALCGIDGTRSETAPFSTRLGNLYVHDNTIKVTGTGLTGVVSDYGGPLSPTRFEHNSYRVEALGVQNWQWLGSTVTFAGWQADGFDTDGSVAVG